MIRLETDNNTIWIKNFYAYVNSNMRGVKVGGPNVRAWHMKRRELLAEYGGKISKAGGRISFVFEDDKHATMFILKWT